MEIRARKRAPEAPTSRFLKVAPPVAKASGRGSCWAGGMRCNRDEMQSCGERAQDVQEVAATVEFQLRCALSSQPPVLRQTTQSARFAIQAPEWRNGRRGGLKILR